MNEDFTGIEAVTHVLFEHIILALIDLGTAVAELESMEATGFTNYGVTAEQGYLLKALSDQVVKSSNEISDVLEIIFTALPNLADEYMAKKKGVSTTDDLLLGLTSLND